MRSAQGQHSLKLQCYNALFNTKYKRSEGSQQFKLDQRRHLRRDRARDVGPPRDARGVPMNKTDLLKMCERGAQGQHSLKLNGQH